MSNVALSRDIWALHILVFRAKCWVYESLVCENSSGWIVIILAHQLTLYFKKKFPERKNTSCYPSEESRNYHNLFGEYHN